MKKASAEIVEARIDVIVDMLSRPLDRASFDNLTRRYHALCKLWDDLTTAKTVAKGTHSRKKETNGIF